jgi:hypothetical protein
MSRFLTEEAEAQTRILVTLRGRLERGQAAADPAKSDPPSREWVRACRLYFDGYRSLANLELEHAKIRLMAERSHVRAPMSDDEFQQQIAALGRQALDTLSAEDLEAALARKRAIVVTTSDRTGTMAPMNPQHQDEDHGG